MGRNKTKIIIHLIAFATFSTAHGFSDTGKIALFVTTGVGNVRPTLFGSKHNVPWNNNSTFIFTYFDGNSNNSVLSMIPGKIGWNLQAGIEKYLKPRLALSIGIGYQQCQLQVLRFNYDSTWAGNSYRISANNSTAFFPWRYIINYRFINLPILVQKSIPVGKPRLKVICGVGLCFKAAIGQAINTKNYYKSMDSIKLQTGVNIIYNSAVGIAPIGKLGIEYSYNSNTNIIISGSFENIVTRQFQRIDIVDSRNSKLYYSSISPSVSNWGINIGVIRKIK